LNHPGRAEGQDGDASGDDAPGQLARAAARARRHRVRDGLPEEEEEEEEEGLFAEDLREGLEDKGRARAEKNNEGGRSRVEELTEAAL
jgi:hypothetical protein